MWEKHGYSIKYWLGAYQVIDFSTDIAVQTDFGELIDKYDPYLENPATLWLLHWKLCTNPDNATFYYWFFNYLKKQSSKIELINEVVEWLMIRDAKKSLFHYRSRYAFVVKNFQII